MCQAISGPRAGPYLTTATWRCRENFSQWERSFLWKLRCHWLKGLRQRKIAVVRQGPEYQMRMRSSKCCWPLYFFNYPLFTIRCHSNGWWEILNGQNWARFQLMTLVYFQGTCYKNTPCFHFSCNDTWTLFQHKDHISTYRDFHYKERTIDGLFYLYNGDLYTYIKRWDDIFIWRQSPRANSTNNVSVEIQNQCNFLSHS